MKLILEISTMDTHASTNNESKKKWVRISGTNQKSEKCVALATGFVAEAIVKKINDLLLPGETVASRNFMIDLTGEWQTENKEYQGKTYRNRRFYIESFDILLGHNLELAKIRKDGSERLSRAEQYRADGKLEIAYRELLEFASRITGKQIDLGNLPDPDDIEFGEPEATSSTPEAAAAARFKAADRTEEKMEFAEAQESAAAEQAEDQVQDTTNEASSVEAVGSDVVEDEADTAEGNEHEVGEDEDMDPSAENSDPLDDEPVAQVAEEKKPSTPKFTPPGIKKPTAFPRFGFPRPGA